MGIFAPQDDIDEGNAVDRLISDLGGPRVPATGFAIGEDRLIEVLPESFRKRVLERVQVAVLPLDEEAMAEAFGIARQLVGSGLVAQTEVSGRSLKAGLKWAGKLGARVAILVGGRELADRAVVVRDLDRGEQQTVPLAELDVHLGALVERES